MPESKSFREKYPHITFTVSHEQKERIEREAKRDHRSVASFVRSIVLPELERREEGRKEVEPA